MVDIARQPVLAPRLPWRAIAMAALLIALLLAAAAVLVGTQPRLPAPFGLARQRPDRLRRTMATSSRSIRPRTSRRPSWSGPETDLEPKFSLDGTRLVFERRPEGRAGGGRLYVAHADGTALTLLTPEAPFVLDTYDFSPDGLEVISHRLSTAVRRSRSRRSMAAASERLTSETWPPRSPNIARPTARRSSSSAWPRDQRTVFTSSGRTAPTFGRSSNPRTWSSATRVGLPTDHGSPIHRWRSTTRPAAGWRESMSFPPMDAGIGSLDHIPKRSWRPFRSGRTMARGCSSFAACPRFRTSRTGTARPAMRSSLRTALAMASISSGSEPTMPEDVIHYHWAPDDQSILTSALDAAGRPATGSHLWDPMTGRSRPAPWTLGAASWQRLVP